MPALTPEQAVEPEAAVAVEPDSLVEAAVREAAREVAEAEEDAVTLAPKGHAPPMVTKPEVKSNMMLGVYMVLEVSSDRNLLCYYIEWQPILVLRCERSKSKLC